jgi:hypothetical protein
MSCLQDQPIRPRFSVVLLSHRANDESVPKIHVASLAYHAAFQNTNFKFFPKTHPPHHPTMRSNFFCNVSLQTHNLALLLNLYLLLPTPNFPILTSLPSLLPQVLPCYQSTFAPKVPGHYLGTFRAGTFSDSSFPL